MQYTSREVAAQTGLSAALSGADMLEGIGILDDNNVLSLTQMIVDSEIARMVKRIREGVAAALGVQPDRVSVKGKTNEGVDAVGRGEAIAAHAVAMIR